MTDPCDALLPHERELLDVITELTAKVAARTILRDFTYMASERYDVPKAYTDEGCVLRALTRAHFRHLIAAGHARPDAVPESTRRAQDDLERILVVAQTIALDRLFSQQEAMSKGQ